jgi:hypothetical protein
MYYYSISEAVRGKKEKWGSGELCWQPPVFFNPGPNDKHIGKLVGQKLMDEIDYFCFMHSKFSVNFLGSTYVGGVALCQLNALAAW